MKRVARGGGGHGEGHRQDDGVDRHTKRDCDGGDDGGGTVKIGAGGDAEGNGRQAEPHPDGDQQAQQGRTTLEGVPLQVRLRLWGLRTVLLHDAQGRNTCHTHMHIHTLTHNVPTPLEPVG